MLRGRSDPHEAFAPQLDFYGGWLIVLTTRKKGGEARRVPCLRLCVGMSSGAQNRTPAI
jgi:hypothetical protein